MILNYFIILYAGSTLLNFCFLIKVWYVVFILDFTGLNVCNTSIRVQNCRSIKKISYIWCDNVSFMKNLKSYKIQTLCMWNTFSVRLCRSAESASEAIFLALHSVSHSLKNQTTHILSTIMKSYLAIKLNFAKPRAKISFFRKIQNFIKSERFYEFFPSSIPNVLEP